MKNNDKLHHIFEFTEGIFINTSLSSLQLVKIDRQSGTYEVDGLAAQIIEKIDGETSLQDIVQDVAVQSGQDADEITADVASLVGYLLDEKIIKISQSTSI